MGSRALKGRKLAISEQCQTWKCNERDFQVTHPMNYYSSILDRWNKKYFPLLEKQTNLSNNRESNSQQKKNGDDQYSLQPSLKPFQPLL